jgi:hypothetical protein
MAANQTASHDQGNNLMMLSLQVPLTMLRLLQLILDGVGLGFGRSTHNIIIHKLQNVFGVIFLCKFDREKILSKFCRENSKFDIFVCC